MIYHQIKEKGQDSLEEFFPKGKSKERGAAIVMLAEILIELRKLENENTNKENTP